ncbi:hypothetical protein [Thiohalocapsa sp. ML1]|jgi:hypothetical protein|uniref:hypothetical protein n=1 Tax=Thiohalocapsa sp. ML1 TaxID=1431688 RepID=UPI00138F2E0B|nr:hypothetical protein [Thiohalocapsa sp. ML1]
MEHFASSDAIPAAREIQEAAAIPRPHGAWALPRTGCTPACGFAVSTAGRIA